MKDPIGSKLKLFSLARAYDTPIPGYATFNTIGLRLWKSVPVNEFDFVGPSIAAGLLQSLEPDKG